MFYLVIKKKRCIIQTFSLTCCLSVLLLLLLALLLLLLPSCRSRHLSVVLFPPLLLLLRLLPFTSLPLSGLPLPLLRLPLLLQLWWRIRNKTNYIRFNVYDTWDLTNANLHTFFPQKAFLSCTVDLFLDVPHVLKNLKEKTLSSTNCCPFYSSLLSQWVFFLSHLVGTLFALLLIQTVPCCLGQAGLQRVILQIQPLQTLRAKTDTERGQNKASSCKTWYVWLSWLCMDISFWQLIHWSAEYRNISAEVSTICKWSCSQQQVSKKTVNSYRSSVQTHKLPVQTLELLVGWYFTSRPVSSTSNLCAKHIELQKKSESGINLPADVLTAVRHCEKYMTILKVSNIGPSPFPIWSMSS